MPKTPDRPLRHTRGFVTSYGQGRTCAAPACETTLSRYNKAELCWKHLDQAEVDGRAHR